MYLKRLELQGFKSFAEKTTLELMPGITAVIGPNGSGKSNISDAIRWVLGEQSMKSLRGQKSEDVIFAGTQSRKSLGFAEVSLIFDNMDGKLPIEYTEVTVTRRLFRSGESEYLINKTNCRLKDIVELFMDTGIGKDGYSIIGQGRIDEILSNKSEDRRHVFEEASGIVKYKARKIESEKKLEQTKLNLLRINDIIYEIEQKIEPLKEQSEKAKKYLNLKEELKNIEIGLFIYNINEYKEKLAKIIEDTQILNTQKDEENNKLEEINNLKQKLKEEIDVITEEIENLHNLEAKTLQEKEQINSDIKVVNERIANNNLNYQRFEEEIIDLKEKKKSLEEEVKQKEEKKINLFANKEKFEKELEEKQKELDELTNKLSEKEKEIEEHKKIVEQCIDDKFEKSTELSTYATNLENFEKREKNIKIEIQQGISELDGIKFTKEDIAKAFYDIENKRKETLSKLEEASKNKEDSIKKIKEYEDKINLILSEYRIKESKLKFLKETEKEKEGYTKSVKNLLLDCEKNAELAKGVNGVLSSLIEVDKEYGLAIEMALGGALQNIVTETENDAKKLVEHLRKNNIGRASFLPISAVKGKKLDKINNKNIAGVHGIASDLVKYNSKYDGIIQSLLGRVVIVEDMAQAIELAKQNKYSFKIVTLKGDIINPSGMITGGSAPTRTVNILGRAGEIKDLEKALKEIEEKVKKLEKEKEDYKNSVQEILEKANILEEQLKDIDIQYATDKQKLVSVEENIEKAEKHLQKLKEESSEIKEQKEEIEQKKKETQKEIEDLENQKENLSKIINEYANLNKDNQKYIDDLNFDVTNLKISVNSFNESEMSIDEVVERINNEIETNNISVQNKEENLEKITLENEKLAQDIKNFENRLAEMDKNIEGRDTKVQELKQDRNQKNEKLSETENKVINQFETLENIKSEITKIEIKKEKIEHDIEDITNKLWEEYELTPNNVSENYQKPTNVMTATKEASKIREEIKNLGSVNVDSIEEYKNTSERYDFMCEQRLDIENSMAQLKNVITEITETMKAQFLRQFKIINENFKTTFKELFGGGTAELILEDESNILETGIEIKVQPPGKKLQNMMLLSGGERAFTAIALLFSMLKINPSPFCILDEIEAALDDVNVYRFAEYIKKFTGQTQFLTITHRKGTMEQASTVYGVTMEENGISKLLSMKLN
ncbi:MAG: chromosome segregation protein SMC [Clostridia bacterium]|nr:chromosome segregation protein SMC [Clostridia bacterium]